MERVARSLETVSEKLRPGRCLNELLEGFDDQLKVSMEKLSTALATTMQKVSDDLKPVWADWVRKFKQALNQSLRLWMDCRAR